MTTSDAHDLVTPEDVVLMQGLAQRIVASHPKFINPDASFGELAWIWGKGHLAWRSSWPKRLWFDAEGRLVAWGWAQLPFHVVRADGTEKDVTDISLAFQVHPDHQELVDEVIAWFESITPTDVDRRVIMQSNDAFGLARWAAYGYPPDPEAENYWTRQNIRKLDDIDAPTLPEGYRLRTAAEVGHDAAAQAHVQAWWPSSTTVEMYQGLNGTATYRPDLHVVVEAPDGTMAASAIGWLDELNRAVEFEPVGTHREHRRLGLAQAAMLQGMLLAKQAGAVEATVVCVGTPDSGALPLYEGIGFQEYTRDVTLLKPATKNAD
ncbi:GNAT family N-acetyltransferase [Streptacidiphilus sp. N1-10]|uniref:GNAT family N-acetyltransferase n=1 Tax=Streptacidiphilus jeojiensis TaxID=3229225 RepID=A0ABV6XG90_9ACTN